MYAVFETGGKQYRASAGDLVKVEMLGSENGSTVTFDRVLLVNNDGKVRLGDAVQLLNYVVRGMAPPAKPFPSCGLDPDKELSLIHI